MQLSIGMSALTELGGYNSKVALGDGLQVVSSMRRR
jgi:hypothetical protein